MPSAEQVREALQSVAYPDMTRDIISFGMVKDIAVNDDGTVRLEVDFKTANPKIQEKIMDDVKSALAKLEGVKRVELASPRPISGAKEYRPGETPPAAPSGHNHGRHGHSHDHGAQASADPFAGRRPIHGVKTIVAVASGKGGVGKSTVATNLAVMLEQQGLRTGLLDADIYGPSVHVMFGAKEMRPTSYDGKTLEPFVKHGVKFMSIGLLLGEDTPVIWRGPMVMKMLDQFLRDVNWGDLDVLIIDLPPGTGDAQLSLVQKVPLTGAVIVTTPQDVALADAVRGLEMFNRVSVPVIGLAENMSFFHCPECGHEAHIFRKGGGERVADRLHLPLLAHIPLNASVCEAGDEGVPVSLREKDSPVGEAFRQLAKRVVEFLETAPAESAAQPPNVGV